MENEVSVNYNHVTGPGQSKSNLTEGLNYLDILSVRGSRQSGGTRYDFSIGGKMTDDENHDIKQYSLTHFHFKCATAHQVLNFGDTFEFFSPYTLSSSVKGASYKYRDNPSPWIPKVTMLYGQAAPRWDALWGGKDTAVAEREVYGARVMYRLPFHFKTGLNMVNSRDTEPVSRHRNLHDTQVYSIDFDFRPVPEMTITGESAFNDTRISAQSRENDTVDNGHALRIKAMGEYAPFRIFLEYARISPEFINPMGSATADREKIKFNGQYQFNKKIHLYTNFLWFRDNLDDQKPLGQTDVWRPEVGIGYNNPFHRPAAFAKISYRKEISERRADRLKFDDLIQFNYRDAFGAIETDTHIGYNLRQHENTGVDNRELVCNTTLQSQVKTDGCTLAPSLYLGGWRLEDELSTDSDRAYQYSLGMGIDWPMHRVTTQMSLGLNELKIDAGDDSTRSFGNFNITWEPILLSRLHPAQLYIKGTCNDFNFSTRSKNFREEKVFAGMKIQY